MIEFHPTRIPGRWRDGYALDLHTVSSTYVGDDEFGHARFETQRSPAGELLIDDLFRSGATMNSITASLYDDGRVADVFALTMTRTRSNQ